LRPAASAGEPRSTVSMTAGICGELGGTPNQANNTMQNEIDFFFTGFLLD
jgi:hypothetical protein